jgi:hypothetical protein
MLKLSSSSLAVKRDLTVTESWLVVPRSGFGLGRIAVRTSFLSEGVTSRGAGWSLLGAFITLLGLGRARG